MAKKATAREYKFDEGSTWKSEYHTTRVDLIGQQEMWVNHQE
ncbi:MAG: hypothetical protein Q7J20_03970 [Candidatus Nitrotoga sp.]|nr:hypothetical protein [Candidatus Nitrotoga sp.]MDO9447052.1 hypothetical protein [Candidatus Nitrotoga sp.]MDP1639107.1 hypothetical protein [Candidatus Nitrotoga sp.]MDP3496928.1 hypothetical protein [Candidatus Nitrotoga sp.]